MRQIVLDTETTGLEPKDGHRIIEIGCIELINRRITGKHYHVYINPERDVEAGAEQVHGLSNQFLADKPVFADIVDEFIHYVDGADLIIHNAPFDIGFINHELRLLDRGLGHIDSACKVIDTLVMARKLHPGQRNSLDALCKRYGVDNSARNLHGALIDADLLASTYLAMTSGQDSLFNFSADHDNSKHASSDSEAASSQLASANLPVIQANAEELTAHEAYLDQLSNPVWRD